MDKTFTELDLDSLEKVTGGATFDFFDEENKQEVGVSKPCPICGKGFYVTLGKTVCNDCKKKGYS